MSELINSDKLDRAIEWFTNYVTFRQNGAKVDFHANYIKNEEGYKYDLFENAHKKVNYDAWTESMIGSYEILGDVVAGLNEKDNNRKNNIVDFHSVTKLRTKAEENIVKAEKILYKLYKSENTAVAFSEACVFFGKWYPVLSYMLFMKDRNSYLPVKNSTENHVDRFKKLGIDTSCLKCCSWENYQYFLQVHEEIRNRLCENFGNNLTLLDAHSFVWMLYYAPENLVFDEEGIKLVHEIESNFVYQNITGKERDVVVKTRINQGVFRKRLLEKYKQCCMCGLSNDKLLIASHIKPWSVSTPSEKVDVNNGLLLCPNHDYLFDKGWISFNKAGEILISKNLSTEDKQALKLQDDIRLELSDKNRNYMSYHRKKLWRNNNE